MVWFFFEPLSLVAALAVAADHWGSRPITIPIPSGGGGGIITGKGDSGRGTVGDA